MAGQATIWSSHSGVLTLFILKGPAPVAQNYSFMLRCTPGSTASLGSCLYPGLPPDQLLETLCGCSGSTVFSMMQAVCPLGWGYRWLAGLVKCACPQPPADSRQTRSLCRCPPPPQPMSRGRADRWQSAPDASPLFHRMLAWEDFDVGADFITYWQCVLGPVTQPL